MFHFRVLETLALEGYTVVVKIRKQSMAVMDSAFRMVVTSVGRQEGGIDERHAGELKSTGNILFLSLMFILIFYYLKFTYDIFL